MPLTAPFSLTTRLTAFFLAALALVLVGFSTAIDVFARSSLSRQADARLDAAITTLVVAAEFNQDGLEWEPNQRLVALGQEAGSGEVRWAVHDGRGRLIDRSRNLGSPRLLTGPFGPPGTAPGRVRLGGRDWRVVQQPLGGGDDPLRVPTSPGHHASLVLTAALSLEPLDATVRRVDRLLVGLSAGVWLLAATLGRALSRRALGPLRRMAQAARGRGATGFDLRLPSPATGDELQDLADAFNGLLDRLHEAFERQARFTGDASHQLRTPVAAMLGQIDVALRRERSADEYRRTLALVRDQADRLGRIVEMLLFLARADAEAALPGRQVVDLNAWARDHLDAWAGHPRAADLTVECEGGRGAEVTARVHTPLLGQLLDNLLDNACKYSDPGSPLRVRVTKAGGCAVLSVEDRGAGIAPEDRPHVFEPFYRSARAREQGRPGVGLGLTVARRIASALDGRLECHDTPSGGSLFALTLQLARDDPSPVVAVAGTGNRP